MMAAFSSVALLFVAVYIGADTRGRLPPQDTKVTQTFFQNARELCQTRPELLQNCPEWLMNNEQKRADGGGHPSGPRPPKPRVDIFDPRPWVIPILIGSTVVAMLLALALALLMGQRIARPIQDVSRAARLVAGGSLDARVREPKDPTPGDETAQLARSFNSMAQTLERNENERRQLIADIAHELRTPLTVMQSRLEALEDGVFALDASEIARLQAQTKFLSRLVEDLRVLSLAEAGRLSLERRSVDLEVLVREVAQGFEARAEREGKTLRVNTQSVNVNADPDRVRQVLTNLLENALKYTASAVKLNLSHDAATARVTISDDGNGLPSADLDRVFDRFYRVDESRTRASGGSGLGLSIVKAIVQLHGGSVSARNLEPHGAEFAVAFPSVSI